MSAQALFPDLSLKDGRSLSRDLRSQIIRNSRNPLVVGRKLATRNPWLVGVDLVLALVQQKLCSLRVVGRALALNLATVKKKQHLRFPVKLNEADTVHISLS